MSDITCEVEIMTSPEKGLKEKAFLSTLAETVIKAVLAKEFPNRLKNTQVEVSVLFTDDSFIAELNEQYRDEKGPTDVLSFPMLEEDERESYMEMEGMPLILGDIVISLETAQRQSEEKNQTLTGELELLLVHGVLHLLGYDHETEEQKEKMWQKQDEILKTFHG